MTKTWEFNGNGYEMAQLNAYGQYTINGYHCTDSSIWDNVDDVDNWEKMEEAMEAAERFLIHMEDADILASLTSSHWEEHYYAERNVLNDKEDRGL
ncbi:MAG: hypothetical protein HUJ76_08395 [Parasporobacterium sp.]|nr:hypothetical protein [Parasporobacterium sp.]